MKSHPRYHIQRPSQWYRHPRPRVLGRPLDRHQCCRFRRPPEQVIAQATDHGIITCARFDTIVNIRPVDQVITITRINNGAIGTCTDRIVTRTCIDAVKTCSALDRVIIGPVQGVVGVNHVAFGVARVTGINGICARRPLNNVIKWRGVSRIHIGVINLIRICARHSENSCNRITRLDRIGIRCIGLKRNKMLNGLSIARVDKFNTCAINFNTIN